MSLRWRIALTFALVAVGVGALASTASYVTTSSQLRSGIDDTLRSRVQAVNVAGSGNLGRGNGNGRGGRDDHDNDGGDDPNGCPSPGSFQPASAAQLVSAVGGAVTSCIEGGPTLPYDEASFAIKGDAIKTVTIDGERYRVLTTQWHDGGIVQLARSLDESDTLLGRLRLQLFGFVVAAALIAATLGWAIALRITRPIVRLRNTAHRIASTLDLATPVDVSAPGEVGDLANSFSTMVGAVAQSQEQQRRLVSDASHEMRTPLTSLRSNVELLGQIERLPKDERGEVVHDVLEDIDELSLLLGELVDLASDMSTSEPTESVVLGDVAAAVADRVRRRSGREIGVSADESVVQGRPRQLERAIGNLVENAVKYSGDGGAVDVAIADGVVTVRDEGRGIPEADLGRIFDRFYRAVEARTEPGTGLGLAIVEQVVRSHGGTVFARNRATGGAEVGFSIPTEAVG